MTLYKQYAHVSSLSGANVDVLTSRVVLDAAVWAGLFKAVDKIVQTAFRGSQKQGFPHREIFALLCGDKIATGATAGRLRA